MHFICKTSFVLLCALIFFSGCGQQDSNSQVQTPPEIEEDAPPVVPPTVSIDGPLIKLDHPALKEDAPKQTAMVKNRQSEPEQSADNPLEKSVPGSVEWMAREVIRLQKSPIAGPNGEPADKLPPAQLQAEQAKRFHQIIEVAQKIIVKTNNNPTMHSYFNAAVHDLADARLQLALAGDNLQIKLLNDDADALYKKDATSFAAAEVAFKVVQLTQIQAQNQAASEPRWALAFARQARLFADKFPQETNRAAIQLVAAGRICDQLGMTDDAKKCLLVVEERFPHTPFAEQVQGTLRRLRLPGQELVEFGGSTIDGGFVSAQQLRGKPTIVAFWASNSVVFKADMDQMRNIIKSFGDNVQVVGVNLDRDEAAVQRFVALTDNNDQHIFFSDSKKRGAENPIAKHYDVTKIPSYWLLDANGVVKTVNLQPRELRQHLGQLVITQ